MVTPLHMVTLIRTMMRRVQFIGTAATQRATIRTCRRVRADGSRCYRTAELFAMRSMVGDHLDHREDALAIPNAPQNSRRPVACRSPKPRRNPKRRRTRPSYDFNFEAAALIWARRSISWI